MQYSNRQISTIVTLKILTGWHFLFSSRSASIREIVSLFFYYMVIPPFSGVDQGVVERNYMIVNKNLIERSVFIVFSMFPSDRIIRLERLFYPARESTSFIMKVIHSNYKDIGILKRNFIKTGLLAATGLALRSPLIAQSQSSKVHRSYDFNIFLFSKSIQFLNYDPMTDFPAKLGLNEAGLNIGNDGHVKPEHMETELPKVVKALEKVHKKIIMVTTSIVDADASAEVPLETASPLGINIIERDI